MTKMADTTAQCGAELIVKNLEAHGITHVFGIPGAKVDRLFDALVDSSIETVVTRHEQNAAFIAGGLGRITGKAGVCIATSGPGASNFITGLATANSEGDPVLAIGGAVKLADRLKLTHQTMDTVSLFRPVTKYSVELTTPTAISEVMANAFRFAESGRPGAAFVSTPMDVLSMPANAPVLADRLAPRMGGAPADVVAEAATLLKKPGVPSCFWACSPAARMWQMPCALLSNRQACRLWGRIRQLVPYRKSWWTALAGVSACSATSTGTSFCTRPMWWWPWATTRWNMTRGCGT